MKAIDGSPKSIEKIFDEEFEIPEFQRPYSWGKDECEQLCVDLFEFLDGQRTDEKYFLGCIVVYPKLESNNVLCVIDGQQRLTTLLMFLNVMSQKAITYKTLKEKIYKKDRFTGDIKDGKDGKYGEPRIESLVLAGKDKENLQKVLSGDLLELGEKNQFHLNYEHMQSLLDGWLKSKSADECASIMQTLLDNVVMLPIHCSSEDDALTLFQIINDRGKSLDDSDIFKAKIYHAVPQGDEGKFVVRWNKMKNHENLFRIYMHISRAEKKDIGKEIGLRKYMLKEHLEDKNTLSRDYETILESLEACHWRTNNHSSSDERISAEEDIYWAILARYPNVYWQYPLYVFLNKYMKRDENANFFLPDEQSEEYIKLMKETVRYCFIRGVMHNSVNAIKDTIFKVCVAVQQGTDYVSKYRGDTDKEIEEFHEKLKKSNLGRYRKGLILLNSSLNDRQKRADFGSALQGKYHIEHILPKDYNNYDGWNDDMHKESINRIGNLMPLEKKINIKASNEFFSRKMEKYKESKFQDALDLSEKSSAHWYPDDLEERHTEALKRLQRFFDSDTC